MSGLVATMQALFQSVVEAQLKHPWIFVAAATVIMAASGMRASELYVDGDLRALLPNSAPSVHDLNEISERFGQPETLGVLVRGSDPIKNQAFIKALAQRLTSRRVPNVVYIDWNLGDFAAFVESNRFLYADLVDLQRIYDAADREFSARRNDANPFFVDLDDDAEPTLEEEFSAIEQKALNERKKHDRRFPGGFFQHQDTAEYIALFLRVSVAPTNESAVSALLRALDDAVMSVREESRFNTGIASVQYGGSVLDVAAEQKAITDSAILATAVTLLLVALSIFFFFWNVRSIVLLVLGIAPPIALTFAIGQLWIGQLNAASAFLSAIVIGNGINPHIMWMARFFEVLRKGESLDNAVLMASRDSWPGTLSAACAATAAYASLTVTSFRAFHDFGVIGAVGIASCWIAAYVLTPALAIIIERRFPGGVSAKRDKRTASYGKKIASFVSSKPKASLIVAGILSLAAIGTVVPWVLSGPFEYDFRNLQSERSDSELQLTNALLAGCAPSSSSGNGLALLARNPDDRHALVAQLATLKQRVPRTIGKVLTVDVLLPKRQHKKLQVLHKLRTLAQKAKPFMDANEWARIEDNLPPEGLSPITPAMLPEMVRRPFTEKNGQVGAILYVEHDHNENQFDGKYVMRWVETARTPKDSTGKNVAVAGPATIVADLVNAIVHDGPKAVLAAFLATILLLLVSFRSNRIRLFTLIAHTLGVLWMLAIMALLGTKINFLNFIALPVAFGIGVEYSVNVAKRFILERNLGTAVTPALIAAISNTGGGVILCSLTTTIGYFSLFTSPNQAVNSFGLAMSIAEVTCLVAAVMLLPALLQTRTQKARTPQIS